MPKDTFNAVRSRTCGDLQIDRLPPLSNSGPCSALHSHVVVLDQTLVVASCG